MSPAPRRMGVLFARFAKRGPEGGPARPPETIGQHNAAMAGLAKKHGGIVAMESESFCGAVFEGAAQAAACAVTSVVRFAERNRALDRAKRISLRLAVHVGDVVLGEDKLSGSAAEFLTRLLGATPAGRIFASREAVSEAAGRVRCAAILLGHEYLEGAPDPVEIFELAPVVGFDERERGSP